MPRLHRHLSLSQDNVLLCYKRSQHIKELRGTLMQSSKPGLITNGSRSTVNQAVLPLIPLVKDFHQIYKSVQTKGRDQFPLPIQEPPHLRHDQFLPKLLLLCCHKLTVKNRLFVPTIKVQNLIVQAPASVHSNPFWILEGVSQQTHQTEF